MQKLLAFFEKPDPEARYFVLRYDCPGGKPTDRAARSALGLYAELTEGAESEDLTSALIHTEPGIAADRASGEFTHTNALAALDAASDMADEASAQIYRACVRSVGEVLRAHGFDTSKSKSWRSLLGYLEACYGAQELEAKGPPPEPQTKTFYLGNADPTQRELIFKAILIEIRSGFPVEVTCEDQDAAVQARVDFETFLRGKEVLHLVTNTAVVIKGGRNLAVRFRAESHR